MDVLKEYHFHDGEFKDLIIKDNHVVLFMNQVYSKKKREYLNNVRLILTDMSNIRLDRLFDIKLKKNKSFQLKSVNSLLEHMKPYGYILSFDKKNKQYNMLVDVFYEYVVDLHFSLSSIELIID